MMHLSIDHNRIARELETLGNISEAPPPVTTRIVFTEADLRAREYVKALCREAGLRIREDAVGNTFARLDGEDAAATPVATGSHIDAIPNAGRYDGTVGVLGGLEAIRTLKRSGFRPRRSIELIIFTSEEPTRFGIGCLGSRLMIVPTAMIFIPSHSGFSHRPDEYSSPEAIGRGTLVLAESLARLAGLA
jgi:N-carbamoyl-L-amino-acid hydrolase